MSNVPYSGCRQNGNRDHIIYNDAAAQVNLEVNLSDERSVSVSDLDT
jgi:hypothetical protein